MKNKSKIFLVPLILFFGTCFALSEEYSFEDYARDFEMGILEDEINTEEFHLQQKEKIEIEGDDVIEPEVQPVSLRANTKKIEKYSENYHPLDTRNDLYLGNKLKIYSDGKKVKSDYMTDDFQSSINATYQLSKRVKINTGHISKYVNPDATLGSRKIYINPTIDLGKNATFGYTNSFNQANENIEQEVGLKIKPKLFKDSASFGLNAGTTTNTKNNEVNSNFKFTTDFYF